MPKTRRLRFSPTGSILDFLTGPFVAPRLRVTFRIETVQDKDGSGIKLIGWFRAEYFPELQATIAISGRPLVLDMAELTLVDVEAVRFLSACETQGIELRHCPAYIREWIARERGRKV
jgi:hypothetical protein